MRRRSLIGTASAILLTAFAGAQVTGDPRRPPDRPPDAIAPAAIAPAPDLAPARAWDTRSSGDLPTVDVATAPGFGGQGVDRVLESLADLCRHAADMGGADSEDRCRPDGRPTLTLNHPSAIYHPGEVVIAEATATSLFDGYLYVDFYDVDGYVVHVLPSRHTDRHTDRHVAAGESLVLGDDRQPAGFTLMIIPRYGEEAFVVTSMRASLNAGMRPEVEPAADYLRALRDRLADLVRRGVDRPMVWDYVRITTEGSP